MCNAMCNAMLMGVLLRQARTSLRFAHRAHDQIVRSRFEHWRFWATFTGALLRLRRVETLKARA